MTSVQKARSKSTASKILNKRYKPVLKEKYSNSEVQILNWADGEVNNHDNFENNKQMAVNANKLTVSEDLFNQFFNTANIVHNVKNDKSEIKTVSNNDNKSANTSKLTSDIRDNKTKMLNAENVNIGEINIKEELLDSDENEIEDVETKIKKFMSVLETNETVKKSEVENPMEIRFEMASPTICEPNKFIDTMCPIILEKNRAENKFIKVETKMEASKSDIIKNPIKSSLLLKNFVIISGKSGKPITFKPKNPPVIVKRDNVTLSDDNILVKTKQLVQNFSRVTASNIPTLQPLKFVNSSHTNTNSTVIPTKTIQPEKLKKLTKNLPNSRFAMPIYINREIQTDNNSSSRDISVQTDPYLDPPSPSILDDFPPVSELVEYLLGTSKYSSDLDEAKKNSLLDMSKNICTKEKSVTPNAKIQAQIKRDLKMQFFLDIRDCMSYDCSGNMVIHNAIIQNNLNMMMRQIYVLKLRGVTVNVQNSQGLTPIQIAIMNNSLINIIETLIQNGAAVTVKDNEGNSLLHIVIMYSTEEVMKLLMRCSQIIEIIDNKNDEGLTPLMLAAIEKKGELLEVLLKYGADPNLRDEKSGRTALFHAVEIDAGYIINLLLKYKADPKLNNFLGLCPIDAARDLHTPDKDIFSKELPSTNLVVNKTLYTPNSSQKRTKKQKVDDNKKCRFTFVTSLKKIDTKLRTELQKSSAKKIAKEK